MGKYVTVNSGQIASNPSPRRQVSMSDSSANLQQNSRQLPRKDSYSLEEF